MNLLVVIVLGGMVGYWVVSLFFPKKPPPRPPEAPPWRNDAGAAPATATAAATWPRVLGVLPEASPEAIRYAYRTLMSQYHPDKVASLGVELRELAEAKSKEIGAAYREAMRSHGLDA